MPPMRRMRTTLSAWLRVEFFFVLLLAAFVLLTLVLGLLVCVWTASTSQAILRRWPSKAHTLGPDRLETASSSSVVRTRVCPRLTPLPVVC